ncbi:PREDICTED: uncharacterized protein LOC109129453 [Camelina sativa]|uniref:Uncharacterized protein LOC109129453 n=1 Tax=Camelina sativa TaxID=90675 RepID=A0ABM1R2L3_CAMSA|nr:PREDICTED: uncharacterized protein LOC109129453 [Camelina sativa]
MTKDEDYQVELERINRELLKAYQNEEVFWKQRSRQLWLTLGDKNTGYFHAATKSRRALNNIAVMESAAGNPVYEEKEIVKAIIDYFQQIFTSQNGNGRNVVQEALTCCITQDINETLIKLPSTEEIKAACFSIHPDKAPGPDGFSASFFQSNWSTVGEIISKILTKRLQPILDLCISENQSAFVPQRAISDNVLITHETLHYFKTSKAKERVFMAVKTDMSKAYDRLE